MNTRMNRLARSLASGLCAFSQARARRGALFMGKRVPGEPARVIAMAVPRDEQSRDGSPPIPAPDETRPPKDVAA